MVLSACLWPTRELLFLGIFPVKIKILMPILIILGMFYGGDNVAHFAHLGGIITGASFFFLKVKKKWDFHFSISRYLQKRRMLKWQEEMYKKQHVKESVDEILDKISKKGMKSLTKKEKEFLKDASKYYNE
jgi:flagellar motor component MotA